MTLHLRRAERADRLVDGLAAVLAEVPADPFTAEVVAVPTRGMERWLTQRLSHVLGAGAGRADGVCANVAFPAPDEILGDAVAAASGVDPREDPWRPERTVWPLLQVMDESAGERWCAPLTSYLRAGSDDPVGQGRRFAAASHLADLFAAYGSNRPAMLQAWAAGDRHRRSRWAASRRSVLAGGAVAAAARQAGAAVPGRAAGAGLRRAARAAESGRLARARVAVRADPAAARAAGRARRARSRPPGVPVVAAPVGRSVGARAPAGVPSAVAVAPPRGPDRRAGA